MAVTNYVPTLSIDGFVKDKAVKLDRLYSYFLASQYSQSNLYRGNISSMEYQYTISKNNDELISNVKKALTTYLGRYYVSVQAYVRQDSTGTAILVDLECIDINNATTSLSNTVYINNNSLRIYDAILAIVMKY